MKKSIRIDAKEKADHTAHLVTIFCGEGEIIWQI